MSVILLGIHPRETPREAAADQARHGLAGAFLVGDAKAVHGVTDALGFRYAFDPRIGQYAHVSAIAVLSPDGRLVRWLNGVDPQPAELVQAIADAKAERTNRFVEAIALLCYHYDPRTGRYSLAIDRIMKAASFVTILIVGFVILRLRRQAA